MLDKGIRDLRLQSGLSQERFAQLLGVSLQTVRRWESGLTKPLPIISLKLEELQNQINKTQSKRGGIPTSGRGDRYGEGIEFSIGGLFKGLGGLFDLVSQMAEGKKDYSHTGELHTLGGKAKGVYGLSIKMELEGKPIIEQFGNIKAMEEGAVVTEVREPLVDVLDEENRLVIIAELPGVEKKDIRLKVKDDILELTAETRDRKYGKEVLLPSPVDANTMESYCRNGILKIKLEKEKNLPLIAHSPKI